MSLTSSKPAERIEIGNQMVTSQDAEAPSRLVLASYNIRYGVGRYLISSGLLRRAGYNFPQERAEAVARNIRTAAQALSDNRLLPRPDILALQEADKETARAGGKHIAAMLATELGMSYVHARLEIPRGVKPMPRAWWLNFEEQIERHDSGDTGVALLSRIPLQEIMKIDLPWHECPWRPRLAVAATARLGAQQLRLFNVHIDPHASLHNQHEQLEVVLSN